MERERSGSNNNMKLIKTFACIMLGVFYIFFINVVGVSAKTGAEKEISPDTYTLTLVEKDGAQEKIKGDDIGLKYSSETPRVVTYDERLLKGCINKLSCFDSSKIIESRDANLVYENNSYVFTKEIYGNKVNKDILYGHIVTAIKNGETTINLEGTNCYEYPKIVENSPSISYAKTALNKYIAANITYNFAGLTQVLDSSTIKDWISIDGNFQVALDENKVRNYVDAMANTYTSSLGNGIAVSGGYDGNNHGWIIDSEEETKALIDNIKNGQTITKHPIYKQTSASSYLSNVGDTYVEINMTKQHLWYYKDGYLVVEGDVVTGNLSNGCGTPEGVYKLRSKERNSVLRGPGYASPVSFWMPFVNQIGLHDANWRSEFGGDIYKTDGSHGCVNAPYDLAKAVYDSINPGDPIICYY